MGVERLGAQISFAWGGSGGLPAGRSGVRVVRKMLLGKDSSTPPTYPVPGTSRTEVLGYSPFFPRRGRRFVGSRHGDYL